MRISAANTKHVSSTGRNTVWLEAYRYDTEFVKGNAKEVGCKEYFDPYKKCVMVCTSRGRNSDRSVSPSCIRMVNWENLLRTPICSTRMSLVPRSLRRNSNGHFVLLLFVPFSSIYPFLMLSIFNNTISLWLNSSAVILSFRVMVFPYYSSYKFHFVVSRNTIE